MWKVHLVERRKRRIVGDTQQSVGVGPNCMVPLKKRRRQRPTMRRTRALNDHARAEWWCMYVIRDRGRSYFGGDGG